jgi:hypothetical protein
LLLLSLSRVAAENEQSHFTCHQVRSVGILSTGQKAFRETDFRCAIALGGETRLSGRQLIETFNDHREI